MRKRITSIFLHLFMKTVILKASYHMINFVKCSVDTKSEEICFLEHILVDYALLLAN